MSDLIWIPDFDEIVVIHRLVVTEDQAGVRDRARFEACVGQPHQAFGGVEFYPDAIAKGSILAYSISENQPFQDGNKRTGVVALATVMERNGFILLIDNDGLFEITMAMASGEIDWSTYHQRIRELAKQRM